MIEILYYIRDHLVGTHYFIYAFILLYLMFGLIGYLLKEKYARYIIKLAGGQEYAMKAKKEEEEKTKKEAERNKRYGAISGIKKSNGDVKNTSVVQQVKKVENKENIPVKETSTTVNNKVSDNVSTPKPIPNPTTVKTPTPQPMPNKEAKTVEATKVVDDKKTSSNTSSNEPNLSGTIPEL